LKIINTEIPEVLIFDTDVYHDDRGYFTESFNQHRYNNLGFHHKFLQDNIVYSKKNVLRGLHFQINNPQGKLVQCLKGKIFDVAVDIRKNSDTFLKWVGVELSSENNKQLYIPEGFAHGYCVLSESSFVSYKCTNIYDANDEKGIIWNDQKINIKWPINNPILSEKDKQLKVYE